MMNPVRGSRLKYRYTRAGVMAKKTVPTRRTRRLAPEFGVESFNGNRLTPSATKPSHFQSAQSRSTERPRPHVQISREFLMDRVFLFPYNLGISTKSLC